MTDARDTREESEHSVLAHKYNDLASCPACTPEDPEVTRARLQGVVKGYQAGENADAKHWRERAEAAEAKVQEQAQEIARLKADAAFLVQDYHAEKLSLMERADAAEASLSAQAQRMEQLQCYVQHQASCQKVQRVYRPAGTVERGYVNVLQTEVPSEEKLCTCGLSALSGEIVGREQP